MKKNLFIYSLCLAGLLATSCSQEEVGDSLSSKKIQINVSDLGMRNGEGDTRASTSGVVTTFDIGDEIGVYAVSNGMIVQGFNNLKLTKTTDGWSGFPSDATFDPDTKFYAYYPYSDFTGFSVDKAFMDLIDRWNPASATSYTLGDLMTTVTPASITTIDDLNAKIDLRLGHAMSMIEVTVKSGESTTYKFTNEGLSDYTVTVGASEPSFALGNTTFSSVANIGTNTYRLLVNPATTETLNISVDGKNYSPKNGLSVKSGNYYTMSVGSGAGVQEESYTLQVGDYYLSDGKLVSKNTTLTDEQKAKVIGVVYYVGNPIPTTLYGSSYAGYTDALNLERPECVHGLVYAVDGLNMEGSWGTEMTSDGFSSLYQQNKGVLAECSASNITSKNHRILGYDNTATFKYLNANDKTLYNTLLTQLATKTDAPSFTSGWYLPSYGDIYEIISDANLTTIATSFGNVGKTLWEPGTIYMTSSPSFDGKKKYSKKMYGYDGEGFSTYTLDETPHILRQALAF